MKRIILGTMLAILAPLATADVLIIDEVRQVERMDLPTNGISKADVEAKFGEPESRHDAVGDPPISTWYYPAFRVYFEHNLVITTVAEEDHLPSKLEAIQ